MLSSIWALGLRYKILNVESFGFRGVKVSGLVPGILGCRFQGLWLRV